MKREEKKFTRIWCNRCVFLNAQFAKSFAIGFTRKSIVMQPFSRNNILSDWTNLVCGNAVVKRPATLYSYSNDPEVKCNRLLRRSTNSKWRVLMKMGLVRMAVHGVGWLYNHFSQLASLIVSFTLVFTLFYYANRFSAQGLHKTYWTTSFKNTRVKRNSPRAMIGHTDTQTASCKNEIWDFAIENQTRFQDFDD